jgi:hypothetical protein
MSAEWRSQLDVVLATKRRIVLAGNVHDSIFDRERQAVRSVQDWLADLLSARGYRRILMYDHLSPPRPHAEPPSQDEAAAGEPAEVLRALREELWREGEPCAVIVSHADKRVGLPTADAVALYQLTGAPSRSGGSGPASLAILLYARESSVPPEILLSDPDTAVVRVPVPSFEDRADFFEHVRETDQDALFGTPAADLAHKLQGWRLSEIVQLLDLDRRHRGPAPQEIGSLGELMSLFRAGRRVEYWKSLKVGPRLAALRARIRHQDKALERVVDVLYEAKYRLGEMADPTNRMPRLVIFAMGPPGVGKTLMARTLAEEITGNPIDNFKRFDMSEYQDRHEGQRLTGPPPGYVGHEEGGQATNFVAERPHSVVLFDEIEKGHSALLDKLLHVLDSARMTDGRGVTVDFSDACVVFTSNIGTEEATVAGLAGKPNPEVREHFEREFKRFCVEDLGRPELFSRLNHAVVVFDYIPPEKMAEEVNRLLDEVSRQVELKHGVKAEFDPSVRAGVLALIDPAFGLRGANNTLRACVYPEVGKFIEMAGGSGRTRRFVWDPENRRARGVSR